MLPRLLKTALATACLGLSLGAQALPVIDLGVAGGYSGFFFGDVGAAADVEGRLAVGGNLRSGFDIGYRNAHGSLEPALVVRGNVSLTSAWGGYSGTIYNGPNSALDTNASIGPSSAGWLQGQAQLGTVVYGGELKAQNVPQVNAWNPPTQFAQAVRDANRVDFDGARQSLSSLSQTLAGQGGNGQVRRESGALVLVGDGQSDLQVFDLGDLGQIGNIELRNVKAGAHVVINSGASRVDFSGFLGGDRADSKDPLAQLRDRLLFNLYNARAVDVSSFLNGSVLAVGAAVTGSGHLEGTLIADSLGLSRNGSKLELGYETFRPFGPGGQVPEPSMLALMGLAALAGWSAHRRQTRRR